MKHGKIRYNVEVLPKYKFLPSLQTDEPKQRKYNKKQSEKFLVIKRAFWDRGVVEVIRICFLYT